jgi:uncharacterized protein (DUF1800 family)
MRQQKNDRVEGASRDAVRRAPWRALCVVSLFLLAGVARAQPATDPVYRFYNTATGTHFYTISAAERDNVLLRYPQFAYEGAAFGAFSQQVAGSQPVYRFFNTRTGTHFYTISSTERDFVAATYPQYTYEGAAYYALTAAGTDQRIGLYRFYNNATGAHFYTTSTDERDYVVQHYPQYVLEGIAFYVYAPPVITGPGGNILPKVTLTISPIAVNVPAMVTLTANASDPDGTVTKVRFFRNGSVIADLDAPPWTTKVFLSAAGTYAFAAQAIDNAGGATTTPASGLVATGAQVFATAAPDEFRLLSQTTFGPTAAEVAHVKSIGAAAYIEEQFGQPQSGYPDSDYPYLSLDESSTCKFSAPRSSAEYICARDQLTLFKLRNQFFTNALYKPDQLRQRVAWSLSQLLVVSGMKDPDMETAYVQARYHNILFDEAFGNYFDLLHRVTLSPQMGHYLDMVDNAKADPAAGTEPNENYARELLQLFSIGTAELDVDGTPLLDANGAQIPTYGQAEIKAFARVFTGWTYAPYDAAQPPGDDDDRYFGKPMVADASAHDAGAKTLLRGGMLPPGQTPLADIDGALVNVFQHPNVGPYVAKFLIRQLVTGNPTPPYVARVTAAFNDNGQGKRGDMKAVLRAVLLDPEARGAAKSDPAYGMLKEPVLFITSFLRPLGGKSDGDRLYEPARAMGQDVYYSPTVFNYYPAEYRIPGTSLVAPQFGIHNTNTVLNRANFIYDMTYGGGWSPDGELAGAVGTSVDYAPFIAVAGNPLQLTELFNDRLFGGGMPAGLKGAIVDAVTALPSDDPESRVLAAAFLVATSFQFQVLR